MTKKEWFKENFPNISLMMDEINEDKNIYFKYYSSELKNRSITKNRLNTEYLNESINSAIYNNLSSITIQSALSIVFCKPLTEAKVEKILYNNYIDDFITLTFLLENKPEVIVNIPGIGNVYFNSLVIAVYESIIRFVDNDFDSNIEDEFKPKLEETEIEMEIPEVINDLAPTSDTDELTSEIPLEIKHESLFKRLINKLFKV